jgi:hypothetical protein
MIEVRFSKSKGMIALVQHRNGTVVGTYTFPYQAIQTIIRKITQRKGVMFGQVLQTLDEPEIAVLTDKIRCCHANILRYLEAQITVEASYFEPESKWAIRGTNQFGQEFFLSAMLYNSFITTLKKNKRINFADGSFACLGADQIDVLLQDVERVRCVVFELNKPITQEKAWLRETIVLS